MNFFLLDMFYAECAYSRLGEAILSFSCSSVTGKPEIRLCRDVGFISSSICELLHILRVCYSHQRILTVSLSSEISPLKLFN